MWAQVVAVVALGGCFTKPELMIARDSGAGDSIDSSVLCTGPFEMPMQVPDVNTPNFDDEGPALSPDGQILAFTSARGGDDDIWYAAKLGAGFGAPIKLPGMTTGSETQASWSYDGTKLYFRSGAMVMSSTLRPGNMFLPPMLDADLDAFSPGQRPRFTTEGTQAVYYADSPADVYVATRTTTALAWPAGATRSDIDTPKDERSPAISGDGLTIVFTSDRNTAGPYQLFIAERTTPTGSFATASRLALPGESADIHPDLSRDGTELYISRAGTLGRDLYVATRACN